MQSKPIHPTLGVRCEPIQILPPQQPNRVLIHKPPGLRLVIAHQVVMQSGLFIVILVLKSKRLMRILINPLILFQTTPCGVFAVP